MRGSDFQNLPIQFLIGWPATILVITGLLTFVSAIGFGIWWIVSHLQWVW